MSWGWLGWSSAENDGKNTAKDPPVAPPTSEAAVPTGIVLRDRL